MPLFSCGACSLCCCLLYTSYANNDMADLEAKLQEADAAGARVKLISTDGVFSMDGIIAQLDKIHELAAKYNAIVHFDDCHATGFLGEKGRGTHESVSYTHLRQEAKWKINI